MRLFILIACFFCAVSMAAAAPCPEGEAPLARVTGGGECLLVKTFPAQPQKGGVLFVLLHGNHSQGGPAVSMMKPAEELARRLPGAAAVALIRPGYPDAEGRSSSGSAEGRNDNMTAAQADTIGAAIQALRKFHRPRKLVLIGHSGGANIAGVLLGRRPGLAEAALLAACPCDIKAWRAGRRGDGGKWQSESALDYVPRLPAGTRVTLLAGAKDEVTPPMLAAAYAGAMSARGFAPELMLLAGYGHADILNAPELIEAALRLAR